MIKKEIIKAYALKNAINHNGKAIVSKVISGLFNEGLKKNQIKEVVKKINGVLKEVNKLSLEKQKIEFIKLKKLIKERTIKKGLRELPNAKNGIITRFSPSASGPFHIGHALTASLSFLYFKKYRGKFYVRIEDTNPDKSYKDSYKMIKEDSKWLFNNKAKIIIQSERMNLYYKYIEKLIRKKNSYVCICKKEEFKKYCLKKKNCPCRILSVKENLKRWSKMLEKGIKNYKQGEAVLRFKSDMKHKNIAMRDFPLARINTNSHPLQNKKYKVWPLMNLAVSVDDIEMKITHIIRAKEHRDNAKRQEMLFKALNKKFPWTGFLGRIHFKDIDLSTSKIREEIKVGKYSGWDDKNLPTLQSLRKQGYKPKAFWKFAEQIGLNEVDKKIDKKEFFLLLDAFNKK